nr:histidinol-phosphate transaminase [uncultured Gemmiger sp.]
MPQLIHGGDWAGFAAEYGTMPLDFSANISPLGLPDGVRKAIVEAAEKQDRYPDPLCRELRAAIARSRKIPADWVLCGNGAADLIWRLALAERPRHALLTAPTFAEYAAALRSVDCRGVEYTLHPETDFALDRKFLDAITPETDLILLCEPDNPTGRTTDPALLREILDACAANGTMLAVDECFNEFLDDPAAHTLEGCLPDYPNLLIFKAFTKWYAMAGVRLGYVLSSNTALLERLRAAGQPWAVSGLAQAAGLAALQETEYSRTLHALISAQRPRMIAGLTALGCRVVPGQANYLLFYHGRKDLVPALRKKGVLLRDCSNYAGLGPGWYRCAVRSGAENDAFLQAMKEVL